MNITDTRRYEMLVRVRDFGDTYGHLFPESSVARQQLAIVAAAVKELAAHDMALRTASVAARADRKAHAHQALIDRLSAMSQTARVLARTTAGFDAQFQVPRPARDQALLTAGRTFAREAGAHAHLFVQQGMPQSFVADLEALIDAFEHAVRDRGLSHAEMHASRASTSATIKAGLDAVSSLNAIVTNHFNDDAVTTAMWDRVRRIARPERTPKLAETPVPAPAAEPSEPTVTPATAVTV